MHGTAYARSAQSIRLHGCPSAKPAWQPRHPLSRGPRHVQIACCPTSTYGTTLNRAIIGIRVGTRALNTSRSVLTGVYQVGAGMSKYHRPVAARPPCGRPQARQFSATPGKAKDTSDALEKALIVSECPERKPTARYTVWEAVQRRAVNQECWSPGLLLRACQTADRVSEVRQTIELLSARITTLKRRTLTLLTLHFIQSTIRVAVAIDLRLLNPLTEYVLAAAEQVRQVTDRFASNAISDMLTQLAFQLVAIPDDRSRNSAVAILNWARVNELRGLCSRLLAIFSGFHTAGVNRYKIGPALSVDFETLYPVSYSDRFWSPGLWHQMKMTLAKTESRQDVLLVLAAMIRMSASFSQWEQSEYYFSAANELYGDRDTSLPLWQNVMAQYLHSLLDPRDGDDDSSALQRLSKACDDFMIEETTTGSRMLWKEVLRAAADNPAIPAAIVVDLLRSNEKKKARPQPSGRFHIQRGPPHALLEEPVLYTEVVTGLTNRPFSPELEGRLVEAWELSESCGVKGTSFTVWSMLRFSILANHWNDAIDIFAHCSVGREALVNDFRKSLASWGHSVSSASPATTERMDRILREMDPEELKRFSTSAVKVAMDTIEDHVPRHLRAVPAYAVWLFGCQLAAPRAFGVPLLRLLTCSITHTQCELTGQNTSEVLWDGLPPTFQARSIFREMLFAQHPELTEEDVLSPLLSSIDNSSLWQSYHHFSSASWEAHADGLGSKHSTRDPVSYPDDSATSVGYQRTGVKSEQTSPDEASSPVLLRDSPAIDGGISPRRTAFDSSLFRAYMKTVTTMRFVDRFATPEPWREPLSILAWMHRLEVPPSKEHLCDLILTLQDSVEVPRGYSWRNDTPDGSLLGPLWPWCKEWIPDDSLPSESDVIQRCLLQWNRKRQRARHVWY